MLLPFVSGGTIRSVINGADEASELIEQSAKHGDELVEGAGKTTIVRAELPSTTFTTAKLQHEFRHASDFGVDGNWNKAGREAYQGAIEKHLSSATEKYRTWCLYRLSRWLHWRVEV